MSILIFQCIFTLWKSLPYASILCREMFCTLIVLGTLFTHTPKGYDHENPNILENHPKVVPWETKTQFWNWRALKLSAKWKRTMLSDRNIFMGKLRSASRPWPYHDDIIFLEARDNLIYRYGRWFLTLNQTLFDRPNAIPNKTCKDM